MSDVGKKSATIHDMYSFFTKRPRNSSVFVFVSRRLDADRQCLKRKMTQHDYTIYCNLIECNLMEMITFMMKLKILQFKKSCAWICFSDLY